MAATKTFATQTTGIDARTLSLGLLLLLMRP